MINRKGRRRSLQIKPESASFTIRLPSFAAKPPLSAPNLPPYWESYTLVRSDRADSTFPAAPNPATHRPDARSQTAVTPSLSSSQNLTAGSTVAQGGSK
jgi:hypothetical protein